MVVPGKRGTRDKDGTGRRGPRIHAASRAGGRSSTVPEARGARCRSIAASSRRGSRWLHLAQGLATALRCVGLRYIYERRRKIAPEDGPIADGEVRHPELLILR